MLSSYLFAYPISLICLGDNLPLSVKLSSGFPFSSFFAQLRRSIFPLGLETRAAPPIELSMSCSISPPPLVTAYPLPFPPATESFRTSFPSLVSVRCDPWPHPFSAYLPPSLHMKKSTPLLSFFFLPGTVFSSFPPLEVGEPVSAGITASAELSFPPRGNLFAFASTSREHTNPLLTFLEFRRLAG